MSMMPIGSRRPAVSLVLLIAAAIALACSEPLGNDGGGFPTFDGFPVLVTGRHEQAAVAPSNGSVALLPMLQWDGEGEPTSGTVVVQMITSAGATLGSPVNLGTNAGDLPVAAFDGTNFLVVYQLTTTSGTDLYGQFFATSGAASSAAFPITATHDAPAVWSVSFGGGTYLVTYQRTITGAINALARMVSPAGVVSAEIPLNDKGGMSASAFGGTQFLVVYANQGNQILGKFIQPNGTQGSAFTVDASSGASNGEMHTAFNGTNFLVAFADGGAGTGWDVLTQAVSSTGTLVGSAGIVANSAADELPRGLIADGSSFLVTWYGGATTATSTYGTFVDGSGVVSPTDHLIFSGFPASIVAPIDSKLGGSYLAIVNRRANTWDVFGKLLTTLP